MKMMAIGWPDRAVDRSIDRFLLQVVALQQNPDLLNLGVFADPQAPCLGAK